MKNLYTYKEIRDKINSGDNIKLTTIEKMLRHLLMQYNVIEWERDEARKLAEKERLNAWNITSHKSGWVNFPWEKGSK